MAQQGQRPAPGRLSPTATDGDGVLVTVPPQHRRFVKDSVAGAIRTLQAATSPEPEDRVVPLSPQMVGLRFTASAAARRRRAPGDRPLRIGAHEPGASTTDVMRSPELEDEPDGWPTTVPGQTAEPDAVARYL